MSDIMDEQAEGELFEAMHRHVAHWERRATRAERRLEKLKRRNAIQKFRRTMVQAQNPSDLLAHGHCWCGVSPYKKKFWAKYLQEVRKQIMQYPPGKGIPLPRDDIWAGQHYNRR